MLPALDPSALQAFLADPARPADTLRYHALQGFLFAVSRAPELILPSEWQPIIFADQEVEYASLDEAQEILGQITALYNAFNAAVLDAPTLLPADCQLRDDVLANFEDATLMTLSFFSSRALAEAFLAENTGEQQSLETAAVAIHGVLPWAVAEYAHIGRSIATALTEHDAEVPEPTRTAKVGRNAPCPCGSGKKYKHCCGATVH